MRSTHCRIPFKMGGQTRILGDNQGIPGYRTSASCAHVALTGREPQAAGGLRTSSVGCEDSARVAPASTQMFSDDSELVPRTGVGIEEVVGRTRTAWLKQAVQREVSRRIPPSQTIGCHQPTHSDGPEESQAV